MLATQDRLILWMGERHSGKTTSVTKLVTIVRAEGLNVAGVFAPSLYHNGRLMGFNILDLRNGNRAPLARRIADTGKMCPFAFIDDGLRLGKAALSKEAVDSADLVIVDEFGPLELSGRGWRSSVDFLLTSTNTTILLVVRRKLVKSVQHVYAHFHCRNINATESNSINKVIDILGHRRRLLRETT
jgi:nucleoside-triphosphatase THEP1